MAEIILMVLIAIIYLSVGIVICIVCDAGSAFDEYLDMHEKIIISFWWLPIAFFIIFVISISFIIGRIKK